MSLTRNQIRAIKRFPHLAKRIAGEEQLPLIDPVLFLPPVVCIHRGVILDVTNCRCKVYHCKKHGTCSDSKRSGLRMCRGCPDFKAPNVPPC